MPKILIADDSRFQIELFSSYLKPKGCAVLSAGDALQTSMTAVREKPDLIILDINMPGGTGLEVLKRLRMSTKTQTIPVIVVSGNENAEIEASARSMMVADFLHKPVDPDQLWLVISRLLGLNN